MSRTSILSLRRPLTVLGAFLGLTLLMTFPVVLSWRSSLPAGTGDLWQNYWNLWWWKKCLLEGINPLHSTDLFHPFGTDLVFHTHSVFNQVVSMPVNLLFGEAAAYNFCLVLALTLSGFGTYLLVRDLTGSASAGFLAGVAFAYFPNTVEQTLEHLNLFSAQFIPLGLYFLLRWSRDQRRADALAFGACFGLNALCSWHLGLKFAFLVAPWLVWLAWRFRKRMHRFATDIGAASALAVLLVLPLLAPMVALIAEGSDYYIKAPVQRGIDASYLFTPQYANPAVGWLTVDRYLDRTYQASGFVCYLGLLPVALAAVALWRTGRPALPWLAVFAGGLVLSLGAELRWDGTLYESVVLPFSAFKDYPILENLRVANRFMLVAGLGLSVLAGYGWQAARLRTRWALPIAAVILLAEYSWLPFPMRSIEHSPLLREVADRPGAVLDIPFHQRNRTVHNMAAQVVHGRPISGGYLSSYPPTTEGSVAGEPALAKLAGVPAATAVVDVGRLRELGFRTVVIRKDRAASYREAALSKILPEDLLELKRVKRLGGIPDETIRAIRAQLDAALGGAALEDDRLVVYFL